LDGTLPGHGFPESVLAVKYLYRHRERLLGWQATERINETLKQRVETVTLGVSREEIAAASRVFNRFH
jgi:hypothetical protein